MKRLYVFITILIILGVAGIFLAIYKQPNTLTTSTTTTSLQNESLAEVISQYNDGSFKQVSTF